jgi:hypothetical protein
MAGNTDNKFKRFDPSTDKAPSSGGMFIGLKNKGDFAKFYLIDKGALSYQKTEKDFNDKTKMVTKTKFLFLVLDMSESKNLQEWTDGVGSRVKLLECGAPVYNAIHNNVKEYMGDFKAALKLERIETTGFNQYAVTVVPKSEGEFTAGQQIVIESFLEEKDVTLANALEHFAEQYSGNANADEEEFDPSK